MLRVLGRRKRCLHRTLRGFCAVSKIVDSGSFAESDRFIIIINAKRSVDEIVNEFLILLVELFIEWILLLVFRWILLDFFNV